MEINNIFKPDYTPIQMFDLGIFGGNYFDRSLGLPSIGELKLPKDFIKEVKSIGIDKLRGDIDASKNLYGVLCNSPYQGWKERGWIHLDPYGWVNWYINYHYGRRSPDDKRQIIRWNAFKIRHKGMLKKYPLSNKIKQGLLQWGINYKKL